jgi:DNA-binding transcriptional LysR family regulator
MFEVALGEFGVAPAELDVVFDLPSNEAVRGAVEAGAGVTVISRLVAVRALKAGMLAAADVSLPRRHFFSLRHREHHMTQAARAFLGIASDG